MSVIKRLAVSLGRRDEAPNIELARELARTRDTAAVAELVETLKKGDQATRGDCVKVLYELGELEPGLIAPYVGDFLALLRQRNNRLVWGTMAAPAATAGLEPATVYQNLGTVVMAIRQGSVNEEYENRIVPFLLEHLETCRSKEVPQHSERGLVAVNPRNAEQFQQILTKRLVDLTPPQEKRVRKVLEEISRRRSAD